MYELSLRRGETPWSSLSFVQIARTTSAISELFEWFYIPGQLDAHLLPRTFNRSMATWSVEGMPSTLSLGCFVPNTRAEIT